jgi:hypothetical protein
VQVPTPVHHSTQSKQHEVAAQGSGKPCDVAASPVKVRGARVHCAGAAQQLVDCRSHEVNILARHLRY